MTRALRRQILVAAALILPVVLLVAAVRVVGPWISRTYTETLAGEGYASYDVPGEPLRVTVLTRSGEDVARASAERLGTSVRRIAARLTDLGIDVDLPEGGRVRLLVFGTHDDLARFVRRDTAIDFAHNAGYFRRDRFEIAVLADEDRLPDAAALRHEAAHLVVGLAASAEVSPWLSEGLAQLFEGEAEDGTLGTPPVLPLIWAAATARRAGGPPPIATIVRTDQALYGSAGNEAAYFWSAALVAFLFDPAVPERQRAFVERVRAELRGGPLTPAELAAGLGTSLPALDRAFAAWLAGLRFPEPERP